MGHDPVKTGIDLYPCSEVRTETPGILDEYGPTWYPDLQRDVPSGDPRR